jgi:hypothetical protein
MRKIREYIRRDEQEDKRIEQLNFALLPKAALSGSHNQAPGLAVDALTKITCSLVDCCFFGHFG